MKSARALIILSAFVSSAAFAAKPQIQWNPDYDFSALKTFQWSDPQQASLESSDPLLHQHIVNAIEDQLESHGLSEAAANPDIKVTYHMSIDSDVRLQSTSVGYSFGNYNQRGWSYYGYGFQGPIYTDTRVVEIERGSLVIDLWDASSNELVWRGVADGFAVSSDPAKMRKNIDKAIKKMVKQADKLRAKAERQQG